MKTNMKSKLIYLAFCLSAAVSCTDFNSVNKNPYAVGKESAKPYYSFNKSIIADQQNPNDAERVFVLRWAAAARQDGEDGYGFSRGNRRPDFTECLYSITSSAIVSANQAMDLVDYHIDNKVAAESEFPFYKNIKEFARIWRVYLMSEFTDSFGPMPTAGFKGVNPEFNSVKDVYYYMYSELADAISKIDLAAKPEKGSEAEKCDPVYGFNPEKWKNYGVSLWMRLAMRLSEVDPQKARTEFEAAKGASEGIKTADGIFKVVENYGWDDLTGNMTRTWDIQTLSATVANIMSNLGGAKAEKILADPKGVLYNKTPDVAATYASFIKNSHENAGKYFPDEFELNSDNPTKGYFFDGIPSYIDPRAFELFYLPGDYSNRKLFGENKFPYPVHKVYGRTLGCMLNADKTVRAGTETDAKFCWNGLPAGYGTDDKLEKNGIIGGAKIEGKEYNPAGYVGTYPALAGKYRNGTQHRIFFGPWETYFLLAEAAQRGWNAGMGAEEAYNAGIKSSLEFYKLDDFYNDYINSENYNKVGTSVKFSHTAEPASYTINYVDGYTGTNKTTQYNYPDPNKILYKGKKLNDALTKIITQKFIANMPYLPLENWSDHRRLGLPFWEIPASSSLMETMPDWTKESYKEAQKPGLFPQRMVYPNSLSNAEPEGYKKALSLMGTDKNDAVTPLWWAIGGHQ